jgi:hypothetical protein
MMPDKKHRSIIKIMIITLLLLTFVPLAQAQEDTSADTSAILTIPYLNVPSTLYHNQAFDISTTIKNEGSDPTPSLTLYYSLS